MRSHAERAALDPDPTVAEHARATLDGPGLPEELHPLWEFFLLLHAARGSSGFGPGPIQYGDIEAAARLYQYELTPYDVDLLRAADLTFLDFARWKTCTDPDERAATEARWAEDDTATEE